MSGGWHTTGIPVTHWCSSDSSAPMHHNGVGLGDTPAWLAGDSIRISMSMATRSDLYSVWQETKPHDDLCVIDHAIASSQYAIHLEVWKHVVGLVGRHCSKQALAHRTPGAPVSVVIVTQPPPPPPGTVIPACRGM